MMKCPAPAGLKRNKPFFGDMQLCGGLVYVLFAVGLCFAADPLPTASSFETTGKFKEARAVLEAALTDSQLKATKRKQIEFEIDRLARIQKDYTLTRDALEAGLKGSVTNLTEQEFNTWISEHRFDSRVIDGRQWFMKDSVA